MLYLEKSNVTKRPPGCELKSGIVAGLFPLPKMVCLCMWALRIGVILSRLTLNVFVLRSADTTPVAFLPPTQDTLARAKVA